MGEIVLVRHGQANSAATTEEDYDRLSDLGHRQGVWLGDWMRAHEGEFDHILSGTLTRHRQTAAAMKVDAEEDPRLNEIDYYRLSQNMLDRLGVPLPGPDDFADHMPRVFAAWQKAEIEGAETFETFQSRVKELLEEAATPGRRILCVTSGGVIGMVLRHLLELDLVKTSRIMLPIYNTSIHRLTVRPEGPFLAGYNAVPHLDAPDRAFARTYY
jgi:broad specificity phosphatase PhoE